MSRPRPFVNPPRLASDGRRVRARRGDGRPPPGIVEVGTGGRTRRSPRASRSVSGSTALRWASPDSDEAIVGLMARHVLDGELTTFFWRQAYGGSQEAILTAPLFWVVGLELGRSPPRPDPPRAPSSRSSCGAWAAGRSASPRRCSPGACVALAAVPRPPSHAPVRVLRRRRPLRRAAPAPRAAARRAAEPSPGRRSSGSCSGSPCGRAHRCSRSRSASSSGRSGGNRPGFATCGSPCCSPRSARCLRSSGTHVMAGARWSRRSRTRPRTRTGCGSSSPPCSACCSV